MGALENLQNFEILSFGRIQKPGGAGVTTRKMKSQVAPVSQLGK